MMAELLTTYLPLLAPAWAAAALLVLWSAPLGCLVLWQRMAFFADTLAHGALLGVGVALLLGWPVWAGVGLLGLLLVGLLWRLQDQRLPMDALLALLASSLLCAGIVLAQWQPLMQMQLTAWLFGDLLTTTWEQVIWLAGVTGFGLLVLRLAWLSQLRLAADNRLAQIRGVRVAFQRLLLMLMIAGFTVVALKAVGSLLIGALLIIPALSARLLAHSPVQMAGLAILLAQVGVVLGLVSSVWLDAPTGPMIVLCLAAGFALIFLMTGRRGQLMP